MKVKLDELLPSVTKEWLFFFTFQSQRDVTLTTSLYHGIFIKSQESEILWMYFLWQICAYYFHISKSYIWDNMLGQNYFVLTSCVLRHHSVVTEGSTMRDYLDGGNYFWILGIYFKLELNPKNSQEILLSKMMTASRQTPLLFSSWRWSLSPSSHWPLLPCPSDTTTFMHLWIPIRMSVEMVEVDEKAFGGDRHRHTSYPPLLQIWSKKMSPRFDLVHMNFSVGPIQKILACLAPCRDTKMQFWTLCV